VRPPPAACEVLGRGVGRPLDVADVDRLVVANGDTGCAEDRRRAERRRRRTVRSHDTRRHPTTSASPPDGDSGLHVVLLVVHLALSAIVWSRWMHALAHRRAFRCKGPAHANPFNLCPYAVDPFLQHRDRESLAVARRDGFLFMA